MTGNNTNAVVQTAVARMRAAARAFLARGRLARLTACTVVALAAVVWLGVFVIVLRLVAVLVLAAATAWCVWLVSTVWRQETPGRRRTLGSLALSTFARIGGPRVKHREGADRQVKVDLADIRHSVDTLSTELATWKKDFHRDVDRWQRELDSQIAALREVVDRVALFKSDEAAAEAQETVTFDAPVEPLRVATEDVDFRAALAELEADLRLDKLDERERALEEREEQLARRERDLSIFVSQTQAQLR